MSANAVIPRQRKPRIVLVEDEKLLLELWEYFIRSWFREAEVLPFENGDVAWQELSRRQPDLLITDLYHPGLDGGTIISKLAAQQVKFPVLFTTAELDFFQDYTALGIKVVWLPKPFALEEFWRVLNELVGPCDFPADHLD